MHETLLRSGRARWRVVTSLSGFSPAQGTRRCMPGRSGSLCARRQGVVCSLPKCDALVHPAATLVLVQMRARVIDLMAGSSQDHHPGTRQVPRHRRDDVPGDALAHCHTRSHTLQPDRNLRAPCRRKLSATAYQLVFDACNAAWLGCSVLATGSSPSTPCAPSRCSGAAESSLGDVRPHLQVDPRSCGFMVELDRLSAGL